MACTIAGTPCTSWRGCVGLVRITIPHGKPDTPSKGSRLALPQSGIRVSWSRRDSVKIGQCEALNQTRRSLVVQCTERQGTTTCSVQEEVSQPVQCSLTLSRLYDEVVLGRPLRDTVYV